MNSLKTILKSEYHRLTQRGRSRLTVVHPAQREAADVRTNKLLMDKDWRIYNYKYSPIVRLAFAGLVQPEVPPQSSLSAYRVGCFQWAFSIWLQVHEAAIRYSSDKLADSTLVLEAKAFTTAIHVQRMERQKRLPPVIFRTEFLIPLKEFSSALNPLLPTERSKSYFTSHDVTQHLSYHFTSIWYAGFFSERDMHIYLFIYLFSGRFALLISWFSWEGEKTTTTERQLLIHLSQVWPSWTSCYLWTPLPNVYERLQQRSPTVRVKKCTADVSAGITSLLHPGLWNCGLTNSDTVNFKLIRHCY